MKTKPKMMVFYHNRDLDGVASAAVIKHLCAEQNDIELLGFDYGQPFPWDRVDALPKDGSVVMVDVSLPFAEMVTLEHCLGSRFIWIDHHQTAIEAVHAVNPLMQGRRIVGKAACELAWEYFSSAPVPAFIKRLSDYDVWNDGDKHAWNFCILPFQFGMRAFEDVYNPCAMIWEELFVGEVEEHEVISAGSAILNYQKQQNAGIMKRCAFECRLDVPFDGGLNGYFAIACNSPFCNSQLFDGVYDPDKHDLMVAFYLAADGKYTVSLYTTGVINVGELAKRLGGGGHAKAAGFRCEVLPLIRL